jgi:hypothetical protein
MMDPTTSRAAQPSAEVPNPQESTALRRVTAKDLSLISVIPKWAGNDSTVPLAEFFELIEGTANIGNWDEADKMQVCVLRLTNQARDFYRATTELRDPNVTWASFKRLFTDRFRDARTDQFHFTQLQQVRQRKDESPSDFLDRCKILARRTVPIVADVSMQRAFNEQADRMLLAAYCAGLAGTVGREVRLRSPASVSEAVRIAVSVEQAELFERRNNSFYTANPSESPVQGRASEKANSRGKSGGGATHAKPSSEASSAKANDRRLVDKSQTDARVKCYECSGYGHFARDCANRRQRAQNPRADTKGHSRDARRQAKTPAEN